MNRSNLCRSLLALSVAAVVAHSPALRANNLDYDLGNGPLVDTGQYHNLINLNGSLNLVESTPQTLTSAATFAGVSAGNELTHRGSITIDGATHGVGINVLQGSSGASQFSYNFVNEGTIKVNGLANAGDSVGISHAGSAINGNFINKGDIAVSGMNAVGVSLVDTTMGYGIPHGGSISASGSNARALYLNRTSQTMPIFNEGTLRASGANSEGLRLESAAFNPPVGVNTASLYNDGTIVGDSIGIHVLNQPANQGPLTLHHFSGAIEGSQAAIQVDDGQAYFYWLGGVIKGDLLGLTGMKINGNVAYDGATIKAGYVTVEDRQLKLLRPHTTIIGNFDMESAESRLQLVLGNDTQPGRPVLTVTGTTEISPGGHLELQARSSDFRTPAGGNQYTLIRSGQLIGGENLAVVSSSALLEVSSYGVEGNDVKALINAKSNAVIEQNTKNGGASPDAAGAVVRLSNAVLDKLDEQDPVFQAFAHAGTDAEVARLAAQLGPDVSRGVIQAATQSQMLVANAITARASNARNGLASGDALAQKGLWLQALSSDANQDVRHGVDGYDANSHGIALGADGQLNAETTLGVAYSYLDTDVKSDAGSKTDVSGHALTVYGNWTHDNWFLDSSLTYGWNDNESRRYIAGTRAKGDYDSEVFGVNALAGYRLQLDPQWLVEPQIGARYANVSIDGYREKGSSVSLNVGSQRYEVGEMGIGARLAAAFEVGQGSLEPSASVMAWHDFIGDKANTTSTFVLGGSPFTTSGATPARDSYELGLGATYRVGAWSVGGSYNYLTKTDFNSDTFTAKVRYDF
ncbi:autotransporter outer membrane beta-barrel domain-containing protein [Pseudomonas purpurea]|uniref:autotransporter family protein n=1 Tax=Pseudomonas purpurea TaxID=3136737 RepID=UPI0032650AE7